MSLRDHTCFQDLAQDVRAFAQGRPIVEIVNSGNWGDALIHAGQAEFLHDIGVDVIQIPVQKLQRSKPIKTALKRWIKRERAIVTGSGAYRDVYARPAELAQAAKRFAHVLVMPSSYPFRPSYDANRTTYWRRDDLESMGAVPEARFCHDMAFYLQPAPRDVTQDVGVFFRADAERTDMEPPPGNIDISAEGTHKSDIEPLLDRIGACRVVHTNRLHVGIGAALLGREVHVYPGSNRKIEAMFKASLEPYYQDVHFHHEVPQSLYSAAAEGVV